jgi:hypothetical protein
LRVKSQTLRFKKCIIENMNRESVKAIEEEIAELKARWPAHSVPPHMWQQLEDLEDRLEWAKKAEGTDATG